MLIKLSEIEVHNYNNLNEYLVRHSSSLLAGLGDSSPRGGLAISYYSQLPSVTVSTNHMVLVYVVYYDSLPYTDNIWCWSGRYIIYIYCVTIYVTIVYVVVENICVSIVDVIWTDISLWFMILFENMYVSIVMMWTDMSLYSYNIIVIICVNIYINK